MTNKQTGDSAATAVAMFTGVKTTYKTLGYDSKVVRGKPSTHKVAEKLSSILSWAQEAGMKTGFVTNSRLTHATPAALYAHSASRDWECDGFVNRKKVHSSEKVPSAQEVSPDLYRWHVIRKAIWYVTNLRIFEILRIIYFDFFSTYKIDTGSRAKTAP